MADGERKQPGQTAPAAQPVTLVLIFILGLICALAWQNVSALGLGGGQAVWVKVDRMPTQIRLSSVANADDLKRAAATQALVPITHTLFVDGIQVCIDPRLRQDVGIFVAREHDRTPSKAPRLLSLLTLATRGLYFVGSMLCHRERRVCGGILC